MDKVRQELEGSRAYPRSRSQWSRVKIQGPATTLDLYCLSSFLGATCFVQSSEVTDSKPLRLVEQDPAQELGTHLNW